MALKENIVNDSSKAPPLLTSNRLARHLDILSFVIICGCAITAYDWPRSNSFGDIYIDALTELYLFPSFWVGFVICSFNRMLKIKPSAGVITVFCLHILWLIIVLNPLTVIIAFDIARQGERNITFALTGTLVLLTYWLMYAAVGANRSRN